jgi:hypothetical protein
MIIDARLSEFLWPRAIETASYTINRIVNPNETESVLQKLRKEMGHDHWKTSASTKRFGILYRVERLLLVLYCCISDGR